jgi:predicted pyridoxine 5'-phosphate oxidase superfamily flavin-nucleotide-binding protein
MTKPVPSDIAFTDAVKAEQTKHGSRAAYAKLELGRGWATVVTDDLRAFLSARNSCYLATANARGQPYIQHRGGPPGFIRALDDHTLAFADFAGNRQYITVGNLAENDQALLFFMDYTDLQRVKIWGRARVVDADPALLDKLAHADYDARVERAVVFTIHAWDANCQKHIPRKIDVREVVDTIAELQARIAELEAENRRLKAAT